MPAAAQQRQRVREAGIAIGQFAPGPHNAITDVDGVAVGHCSLVEGDRIRTGVTAILPHRGNIFQEKIPAAVAVANGFGKLTGSTQVEELGLLESPIVLTNTLSAFAAADATVAWLLRQPGNEAVQSINPLVGECNDGYLNDIRAQAVARDHVWKALDSAKGGAVSEGCVGAGVGMRALGWKGGVGTSSRKLAAGGRDCTVGLIALTNFGGRLIVDGAPVHDRLMTLANDNRRAARADEPPVEYGSCVLVVATDAPLDARQLKRLARRALGGMISAGASMSHGSGDYAIAFSTDRDLRVPFESSAELSPAAATLRDEALTPLFIAAREAAEEAILNSLFAATTTTGRDGHVVEALPIERVVEIYRQSRGE